eukprot:4250383-Prymnesium_polylepis.1
MGRSSLSARPCVCWVLRVVLSLVRMFLFYVSACRSTGSHCLRVWRSRRLLCYLSCVCVTGRRDECERVGLLGRWVCGLVSSTAVVPVRCLRAVNSVEPSQGAMSRDEVLD